MSNFMVPPMEMPVEEASRLFDGVHQRLQSSLTQKGFNAASCPPSFRDERGQAVSYQGYLPPDLPVLDDTQLGWYLGMLSGWMDYVQQQLAEAYANMTLSKNKLEFIEAHLLMVHKKDQNDKKRPEQERKAMVLTDRRYVETQAESLYHETYYRIVNAIFKSAEQNYSAVSRRITQRQQDIERQKRTSGMGNLNGPLFRQPLP